MLKGKLFLVFLVLAAVAIKQTYCSDSLLSKVKSALDKAPLVEKIKIVKDVKEKVKDAAEKKKEALVAKGAAIKSIVKAPIKIAKKVAILKIGAVKGVAALKAAKVGALLLKKKAVAKIIKKKIATGLLLKKKAMVVGAATELKKKKKIDKKEEKKEDKKKLFKLKPIGDLVKAPLGIVSKLISGIGNAIPRPVEEPILISQPTVFSYNTVKHIPVVEEPQNVYGIPQPHDTYGIPAV